MNFERLVAVGRSGARQVVPALTGAERARTMISGATSVRVGVLNMDHDVPRHAVAPDGSVLFMAPPDSPARVFLFAGNLPPQTVDLTVQDVAHVPQADRVRGSLVLQGTLGPATDDLPGELRAHLCGPEPTRFDTSSPVLRLVPTRVWLRWSCELDRPGGSRSIDVPCEEYRAASADPLFDQEMPLLPHLFDDHPDLLRALAERADPVLGPVAQARPIVLDRYGIVLRLYVDGTHHDRRIRFRQPAGCGCELQHEFNLLTQSLDTGTPDIDLGP
ncbi:MAG: DUF2470 domain-containing protein [Nocardioides sp.]|nr:DUF2470 domain-containing protein [Nocardioides sp.]